MTAVDDAGTPCTAEVGHDEVGHDDRQQPRPEWHGAPRVNLFVWYSDLRAALSCPFPEVRLRGLLFSGKLQLKAALRSEYLG